MEIDIEKMVLNANENREKDNFNWPILTFISFSSIVMGIYRDGITALAPFLQLDFNLTRAELGLYISFLYLTTTLVSVFSGHLVDLKGSKWSMVSGILLVGFLLILHSIAPSFIILLLLAAFSGIGLSINIPAANKGITDWFPLKWRGTATGIWSTAYPIGGLMAASLLPTLGILMGWRKSILLPGGLCFLSAFLIVCFYQDKARETDQFKRNNDISLRKNFTQLISRVDLLVFSAYAFFLGVLGGAILTHFTLFLYLDYDFSESAAGLGFALVHFGGILGRPGWGLICDKFLSANKRKTFLIIGFLFLLISLVFGQFLKYLNPSLSLILILAFLTGFSGRGWQGLFFSSFSEIVPEDKIGFAIGLSMLFLHGGMLLSPPVFGYLADLRESYDFSWILLGLVFFLASIGQYNFIPRSSEAVQ